MITYPPGDPRRVEVAPPAVAASPVAVEPVDAPLPTDAPLIPAATSALLETPVKSERDKCAPSDDVRALRGEIRQVVLARNVSAFDRPRNVYRLIRKAITERGFLCHAEDSRTFFFNRPERRLYDLEAKPFRHFLTHLAGLSSTESLFRFALDGLQTECFMTKPVPIHTFSFYDAASGMLAVSDGGTGVWCRERRGNWEFHHNGDNGILFATDCDVQPWVPEFGEDGDLAWFLEQFSFDPGKGLNLEEQKTLVLVWLLQNLFPILRRTRNIPACLGPQGSAKTSAMRMVGRLFCGPNFDVTDLSAEREDAFIAAVCNRVVVGLDNADTRVRWLEDKLATYATGLRYRLRRLYTTNEEVSYSPRAILMLSSRDPHFRRPDVAERLLPLHFKRPEAYKPEVVVYSELSERRGRIMGGLISRAGKIADSLHGIKLPALQFRMADFSAFGWAVARPADQEDEWLELLGKLERVQTKFASEGDSLVMIIRNLLEADGIIGPIESGELYHKCAERAELGSLPFPRSAQGFGKHLTNMRRVIEVELGVTFAEEALGWRRIITIKPNDP